MKGKTYIWGETLTHHYSYKWIADELAPQLPKELDFVNEAMNAERANAFFKEHRTDVVVRIFFYFLPPYLPPSLLPSFPPSLLPSSTQYLTILSKL